MPQQAVQVPVPFGQQCILAQMMPKLTLGSAHMQMEVPIPDGDADILLMNGANLTRVHITRNAVTVYANGIMTQNVTRTTSPTPPQEASQKLKGKAPSDKVWNAEVGDWMSLDESPNYVTKKRPRGAAPHGVNGKPKWWDYAYGEWRERDERDCRIIDGFAIYASSSR